MANTEDKTAEASKPAIDRNAPIAGKVGKPNTTQEAVIDKAQAMRDGKDPEFVERMEEIEHSKRHVKVERDGETLRVHPDTVEAHINAGWKLAD